MAKNPAFPFYANDYLVDTLRWSRDMKSLHVDLMAESWSNKEIKDDGGYPAGLNEQDKKIWLLIKHKWVLIEGVWINEKLELTRSAKKSFSEKQAKNGKKGGRPSNTKPKQNPNESQTLTQTKAFIIEKENEIENEDWIEWGKQIVEGNDQFWEQANGRKISADEMSEFISVATRKDWKMLTQQKFRTCLQGFKSFNTPKQTTNGTLKIINDKLKADALIEARIAAKKTG